MHQIYNCQVSESNFISRATVLLVSLVSLYTNIVVYRWVNELAYIKWAYLCKLIALRYETGQLEMNDKMQNITLLKLEIWVNSMKSYMTLSSTVMIFS